VGVRLRPPLAGLAWIDTLTRPGARAELAITVSHEHSRCIFSPGSRHFNERQVPSSVGLKSSLQSAGRISHPPAPGADELPGSEPFPVVSPAFAGFAARSKSTPFCGKFCSFGQWSGPSGHRMLSMS
jgi:hypothetical protein